MTNKANKPSNFDDKNSSERSFDSISSNLSSGVHSETKHKGNFYDAFKKPVPATKLQPQGPLKINDSDQPSKITHFHKLNSEKKSIDQNNKTKNAKKV